MNQTKMQLPPASHPGGKGVSKRINSWAAGSKAAAMLAVAAGALSLGIEAQAQTATFIGSNTRLTVPLNYSGATSFTNVCKVSGLTSPADLSISGLPAGVTYSITAASGLALPVDNSLPATSITTNLLVTLNLNGSVPEGVYTLNLNASSGAVNSWPFNLQVAAMWSGASYIAGTSTNWATTGNWAANALPGASDDVVFGQLGATNAATITNVVLSASTELASVRFAPTNSGSKFYTLQINPGVTLKLSGTNGFNMMKDYMNNLNNSSGGMTVTMVGGGALVVSNNSAPFLSMVDNNTASALDMSGLANLNLNVSVVALGDCNYWPFYRAYNDLNANGGFPRSFLPTVSLARTNIITASYADPFNYTNATSRRYSFSFLNTELSGTSTQPKVNFGISNAFYMDSINFVGPNCQGTANFNSIYAASNPFALFRSTNGGRMSVFSISDGGGDTNTAHSNMKATIDFSAGTVDLLATNLFIARDRPLIDASGTPGYQGYLYMGKGVVDVNTAILGYRQFGTFTNTTTYNGYCEGRVQILSNGVFRVNNAMTLGYSVTTPVAGQGSGGNSGYGQVNVLNGGQLVANAINVGGPAYAVTWNNYITVTNASVTISNYIGSANQMLDYITFANGSQLTVNLNALNTTPVVYATNFVMTGSNSIVIAAIKNTGGLTDGQKIPLLTWMTGSTPNFTFFNQSGVNGQIVADGTVANQLDFQVILSTPKTLVWKGNLSSTWDNSTANWVDVNTTLHTNFSAGDKVTFDDTASATSISLSSSAVILPGSITVTNQTSSYVFNNSGGGSIIGTSTLTKTGVGSLEFDASGTISLNVLGGQLTGSGTVGAVTIGSAGSMNFTGIINGNLASAGVAVNAGTINASMTALAGGVVTNQNVVNGTFATQAGGFIYNGGTFTYATGNSVISTNSEFINGGVINGDLITVSGGGTFEDLGLSTANTLTSITFLSGATFIPGGPVITNTVIGSDGVGSFPGAVLLSQGSTNIISINLANPQTNTLLIADHLSFGPSASAQSQNGCTLVLNNVGIIPFALGQSFHLFDNIYSAGYPPYSTGSSTNTYPVIVPATPGAGLAWDLSHLWTSGNIAVVSASSGPQLTNSFAMDGTGTNFVCSFSWDPSYYGYRLQILVTPPTVGLAPNTNYQWTSISGSWTNLSMTITNAIGSTNNLWTNCVFYRLVYP